MNQLLRFGCCLLLEMQGPMGLLLLATLLPGQKLPAQDALAGPDPAQLLSQQIDKLLAERWEKEHVAPTPRIDDAQFCRRVYLDICGSTPLPADIRSFLADPDSNKRSRLVEHLLKSPAHATHMANTWRHIMTPNDLETSNPFAVVSLNNWLRRQFQEHARYDRLVADVLTARGQGSDDPVAFFSALELKPEKLASDTARIFLGLQIGCAQCHDHPFDKWTQKDFWAYAAFFAQVRARNEGAFFGQSQELYDDPSGEVRLPESNDEIIPPRFPGDTEPVADKNGVRRQDLAIWMASRDNPYLAKAAVNWAWRHMMGRGLVHPWDDLGEHNPPSHPELFELLANAFAENGFDLHFLLAAIANSRAYQLQSLQSGEPTRPELFASMLVKPLTAEQLYDSLDHLLPPSNQPGLPGLRATRQLDARRIGFVQTMRAQSRDPLDYGAGVSQALALMNGTEQMQAGTGPLLSALDAPWLSDQQKLETLVLGVLARFPSPEESQAFLAYLNEGAPVGQPLTAEQAAARRARYGDLLWAMLNSAEFAMNY